MATYEVLNPTDEHHDIAVTEAFRYLMPTVEFANMRTNELAEIVLSYLKDIEQRLTFDLSLSDRIDLGDTIAHAEELARRTQKETEL